MKTSYLHNFAYAQTVVAKYPQNIQPISQYFTDLQNGTLPQVSEIEPASDAGLDEHGTDTDKDAPTNIQAGEAVGGVADQRVDEQLVLEQFGAVLDL